MSEELMGLLSDIKLKKQEVKDFCNAGKMEDAKKAKEELKALQEKFDLIYDLDAEKLDEIQGQVSSGTAKKIHDNKNEVINAFVNAIRASVGKKNLSEKDREIVNSMNEGSEADGGLIVPKDIQIKIKELRRSEDSLEDLVNVEYVKTLTGSRIIEKHADQTPFDNIDEEAEFPEESTPQFVKVDYNVKKKGGILKITQELLDDSTENIIVYLKKWLSKKSKATRNFMILAKIREITQNKEEPVTTLDDLKEIFNIHLDPAIELSSVVLTNQYGYNWLDTLKDEDGKYILQPDPTKPTSMLLFGKYPIKKVSNKTLHNTPCEGGYQIPIICGDLKEAITIFDREALSIDISNVAGELWKRDQTGLKARERLDIKVIDDEAVVMAVVPVKE